MGSFYSTCSITDLSITDGNDMYMQLLLPTWVKNPYSIDGEKFGCGEKGLRVSNEGPLGEFVPFGFPIEGKYADSGNISDIVKTRNIEMLEEFFGISIDDIIECATDYRWYKLGYKPVVEDKEKEQYPGQHENWSVGDNKMKNIEILKQLTVTYFNKQHYDFLAEKPIGSDPYNEKQRKEHLSKMIKGLTHLDKVRPKRKNADVFGKKDITAEMRKKYYIIKDKGMTKDQIDDLILYLLNNSEFDWWNSGLQYMFYIPSLANTNMFKSLPIGKKDAEEVKKQYIFIRNMGDLYKVLRPSYYGSQQHNFDAYVKFHEFSVNLVNKNHMELKKDNILTKVAYVLKTKLKNDQKTLNDIKETLADYGYEIKF